MGAESKGRAWFGKIYNKLETILVEVDTFTSQSTLCLNSSDPSGCVSVRGEPKEVAEDRSSRTSSCKSPSDPPPLQNFDISRNVGVEELVQGDNLKDNLSASSFPDGELLSTCPLLQVNCDGNLTSATTLGDEELIITDEESQITNSLTPQKFPAGGPLVFPGEMAEERRVESCRDVVSTEPPFTHSSLESFGTVVEYNDDPVLAARTDDSNLNPIATIQDNEANMRSSNADNPDDGINGKSDVTSSDTNALYDMALREDPSYVDDKALYAVRVRTKKLRSFKRKLLDALTSKRRREKEYEQLAIWFGDADMSSDLATGEYSKPVEAMESEDSQWDLL